MRRNPSGTAIRLWKRAILGGGAGGRSAVGNEIKRSKVAISHVFRQRVAITLPKVAISTFACPVAALKGELATFGGLIFGRARISQGIATFRVVISLLPQQMPIPGIVDPLLVQKLYKKLVISSWRRQNIALHTVVGRHLGRSAFDRQLPDPGRDRMPRDVAECGGHRLYQTVQERLAFLRPQVAARLYPMVLPIQRRLPVRLRQHLEKLPEHEIPADRHETDEDKHPYKNKPSEPLAHRLHLTSKLYHSATGEASWRARLYCFAGEASWRARLYDFIGGSLADRIHFQTRGK